MKKTRLLSLVCVALAMLILSGCGKEENKHSGLPEVAVLMAQAVKKDIPTEINAVGSVEAYRSVSVVPQITGQIQDIHFQEGQNLRKGDLLFTVDQSAYREELRKAEASLTKELAQMENYKSEASRYSFLMEKGAVSKSEYEKNKTNADVQEAVVNNCKAAVEDARLKLSYCSIRAPIDGRAGFFQVNKGTVVTANSTSLVSINQIAPVYVKFSVPEKSLPDIRKYKAAGNLTVIAQLPGNKENKREGRLDFIDNSVDAETGMIKLKALFSNGDNFLWPGQFINVSLWLTMQRGVTVVPAPAVQLSQDSKYVFIVKADKTVRRQTVTVDRTYAEEVVIISGVNPGDVVVTDGHFKLKDGFKVVAAPDNKKTN